ncbi:MULTISPECIES: hypothetical protein [Desulfovibrio]|uniref:hypothetical protein n=1 Tax=Desulfovibrio TaxID=872 RepID=UPI0026EC6610|nr:MULTISPECIES: hypothetical protein [Desulfovibrio]MCI7616969.1 hypothetical protein [Desulfovibrio piger]MDY4807143.1 hypothetical protein [Desulfovibrio sp.]
MGMIERRIEKLERLLGSDKPPAVKVIFLEEGETFPEHEDTEDSVTLVVRWISPDKNRERSEGNGRDLQ